MKSRSVYLLTALIAAMPLNAHAVGTREIMLSAEDGKPVRPGDDLTVSTPDTLRVFTVAPSGLQTIALVAVPASMVGPPESVKMTADGRWAVMSASQRLEHASGEAARLVPDDSVSLIDLREPVRPRLVQSVHAGAGASGVAISPRGDLVLVANARADSLSLFTLDRGHLVPASTLTLPAGTRPVAARFLRGGAAALVVGGSGVLLHVSVTGGTLTLDEARLELGAAGTTLALGPDGSTAFLLATKAPTVGAPPIPYVAAIDPTTLKVVGRATLPSAAEGFALSPSGRFLEVTLLNGTNLAADAPGYRRNGVLAVLSTGAGQLRIIAQANTGRLCQGAAWSRDDRRIVLQCADDRWIESFAFDGGETLRRDPGILKTMGRPGALATAWSR